MDIPGPEPQRLIDDFGADMAVGFTGETVNDFTVTTPLEFERPDAESGNDITYRELVAALTRRNQNLVRLQLELIEALKGDLVDAGQVAAVFQLERLAGKIRRNNENLVALSRDGTEDETGPVPAGDLLRAAVSEIEHRHRVDVQPPRSARIVGRARGDLTRLLAELLDNATTLSGPETRVKLDTNVSEGGGLLIDVEDSGVGMTDAEIAAANARLAGRATLDPAGSSPLGLLVVGHLALRHGLTVSLQHGKDGAGVWVAVAVPPELVTDLHETVPIPLLSPANAPTPPPEDPAWSDSGDSLVAPDWIQDSPTDSVWPEQLEHDLPATPPDPSPDPAAESPDDGDLFAASAASAYADLWSGPPSSVPNETTPIFDEMVSAWFSSSSSEPAEATSQPGTDTTSTWNSAADAGWRVVEAVSRSEPASYTGAGLPRRRRGEQLIPGAIEPAAGSSVPEASPARDAAGVRGRLSKFQHGLNRARRSEEGGRGRHRAGQPDDGTPGNGH